MLFLFMKSVLNFFGRRNDLFVSEAMNTHPKTISPDASIVDASDKMMSLDKGSLLVVEGERLLGIVTKTDIVHNVILKKRGLDLKVSDVMTRKYLSISPSKSISEAAKLMVDYGVRRLPVVEKGKLVGLITQTDLLRIQPAMVDLLTEKFVQQKSVSDIRSLKSVKGVCDSCGDMSYLNEHNAGLICDNCVDALQ